MNTTFFKIKESRFFQLLVITLSYLMLLLLVLILMNYQSLVTK